MKGCRHYSLDKRLAFRTGAVTRRVSSAARVAVGDDVLMSAVARFETIYLLRL